MRTTVLLLAAILAGCAARGDHREGDADASMPERALEDGAGARPIDLDDLWKLNKRDAAEAVRKFGERPRFKFRADEVKKSSTGFVAIHRVDARHEHRIYFREDAAKWLKAGGEYETRGRVESTLSRGMLIYCY